MATRFPPDDQLLSREQFKAMVFARAGHRCVFCQEPPVDAHHVLDRKLYAETGGYYLGNGAAVCERHHWACETTEIAVEAVWRAAGIVKPVLPPGFEPAKAYDKWGNEMLPDGLRREGPLAQDTGMRRALQHGRVLQLLIPVNADDQQY